MVSPIYIYMLIFSLSHIRLYVAASPTGMNIDVYYCMYTAAVCVYLVEIFEWNIAICALITAWGT